MDAHRARVDLHAVQAALNDFVVRLVRAVEAETTDVRRDHLELRLEIVSESDDLRATLLSPSVTDLGVDVRVQASAVELQIDVRAESITQDEFELAVQ